MSKKSKPSTTSSSSSSSDDAASEQKLQDLLLSLRSVVGDIHKQRDAGFGNLELIGKTHSKMTNETRISTWYRSKLKNQYSNALDDANKECQVLREGLSIIGKIKAIQEERRIAARSSATSSLDDGPRKNMRRGVLMSMLQKAAQTLPLWIGKPSEAIPSLCGAVCATPDYIAKPGDKVAARVKTDEVEEQWILAEVITYNSSTNKYQVEDIDEEGKESHILSKRRVVPLPQWKANPETDPDALFSINTLVMALYPQTTCFYRAIISEQPVTAHDEYSVLFEDNSYADGYSPALRVAQKYVVVPKEMRDKHK